jgi:small subunit ribosomal protein S18
MPVRIKRTIKKRKSLLSTRKRFCRFCVNKVKAIDYKDTKLLETFVRERGKVISSRISGNCARHQRRLMEAVKRARFISLIPFTR